MAKRRFNSVIRMGASAFDVTHRDGAEVIVTELPVPPDRRGRFEGQAYRSQRAKVHGELSYVAGLLCSIHGIA